MLGQWLPQRQKPVYPALVAPLTPDDVPRLDLGWRSMFTVEELRAHLGRHPGRSFWVPAAREYVIGGNWRHRREVGSLVELGARGEYRAPLAGALLDACRAQGCPLVIFNDTSEVRPERWYTALGFEMMQEIIVYELHGPPAIRVEPPPGLRFEELEAPTGELLAVDHGSFPYLWWNGPEEFANYFEQGGVRVYLARDREGAVVAYAGITLYPGWGHLDRLAVAPERQGAGLGAAMLAYALGRIAGHGIRRVGLSTQADNHRSQVLYERFGFRRTFRTDYSLYGHWLVEGEAREYVLRTPRALRER